jgi:ABC-type multidrug transport system ATPase subunit
LEGNATVEVRGLKKVYPNGIVAVDGVSFDAYPGVTVLMGPNGSGKTTTLSMIAGALKPTAGKVFVCGYDMWGSDWSRPRQCVGFAPQDMPFREKLSVLENLVWYGLIRGIRFSIFLRAILISSSSLFKVI